MIASNCFVISGSADFRGKCDQDGIIASLIYTLGHSTRTVEELLSLLEEYGVAVLVDVRRPRGSCAVALSPADDL